ncbi:Fe-S-containing hydro-lyase [Candidatus Eisenbacteria bacterium]|uniref:Fe-S-containing hydro-lyase n=1 Tax=Eiseniibacteriota bacterium TaxID=2212470 RepID=A0ABV6YN57_UNCEI
MAETKKITTPLSDEVVKSLKIGDKVSITGVIYTARDAAHKRLVELIEQGKDLPFDLPGQIIYYVGPAPAKPGYAVGSAGPTTSYRMDAYAPTLIAKGLKGMIGKGTRDKNVQDAMVKYGAVYFAAVGGAGALISKSIVKAEVIAYPELGAEAVRRMEVKDFPAIVAIDAAGDDLYIKGKEAYSIGA